MLSPDQIRFFADNGYLVVDAFFTADECAEFREATRQAILAFLAKAGVPKARFPEEGREFDEGLLALEAVDHDLVAGVYDAIFQTPEFLRIVAKRETANCINQLLDSPAGSPLYAFTNRCRIDPPRDDRRTYGWHQEVFYTIPESDFVQTWAPLIRDTTAANGTIEICPGSHREGIAKQVWSEQPGRAAQIIVDQALVDKYPQQVLEMKVGQMLFFDGRLFHRSGKNTSSQVRYSLVGMYHRVTKPEFFPPRISFLHRVKGQKEYYLEKMSEHGLQIGDSDSISPY